MADSNSPATATTDLDVEFVPDAKMQERFDANAANAAAATNASGDRLSGARQVVKDEASKLGGQAGDRLRAYAVNGKDKATGALDGVAQMIGDSAATLDEQVGEKFGGYARQASTAVSDFAERLRSKDVDDLVDDAKDFVRKSPGIAIGAAAAVGFIVARLLRSGVDENGRKA